MNFVNVLTTENITIHAPTWEDIAQAIVALDAKTLTLVMLSPASPKGPPDGDHHMAIGGGWNDRHVVYITEDNLRFWNLEDRTKPGAEQRILMRVGEQDGDYREAQCISREWALAAARRYFQDGLRAENLPWYEG